MLPDTAAPPGPATVKVDALSVPELIASLKLALSAWLIGTPVAPFTGTVDVTTGVGVIVLKLHT
jgi:hypothetical protein